MAPGTSAGVGTWCWSSGSVAWDSPGAALRDVPGNHCRSSAGGEAGLAGASRAGRAWQEGLKDHK